MFTDTPVPFYVSMIFMSIWIETTNIKTFSFISTSLNTLLHVKPFKKRMAEAVRFELTDSFPSTAFKAVALNHSAKLPYSVSKKF